MTDKLKYSYNDLDKLSTEKVWELVEEGLIERSFYMGYQEHQRKKASSKFRQKDKEDGKEYNYPTFEFGMAAYTYALENKTTNKEAMEFAAGYIGKDEDWLKEVKNKRFNHSKEVYEEHKEHPVQKEMVKKKCFDKSTITNSRSVNQLTRRLLLFKDIHYHIENQSEQIEDLEERVRFLEYHNFQRPVPEMTDKEKAVVLRESGLSFNQISKEIGVHRSTVSRWFKGESSS
jgi:hypothetical protein